MPTTEYIAIFISFFSLALSSVLGVASYRRAQKNDTQQDASVIATMLVKLETIGEDVSEIKQDTATMRLYERELNNRVTAIEQRLEYLEAMCRKNGGSL